MPVVTRLARQRVPGDLAAVANPGMIGATQKVADPAGLELGRHELQAGEPLTHAAGDQMHERHLHADIGQRRVGARHVRHAMVWRRLRKDVHRQRHLGFLRGCPEPVIERVGERLFGRRGTRDAQSDEAHLFSPVHFVDGGVQVAQLDRAQTEQPLGRRLNIVVEPVVVRLEGRVDNSGVLDLVHVEQDARVDDFGVDAVALLVLEPFGDIVDARSSDRVAAAGLSASLV